MNRPATIVLLNCVVTLQVLLSVEHALAADAESNEQAVYQVLDEKPENLMLDYFRRLASKLPPARPAPQSIEEWEQRRAEIRRRLWRSLGRFPLDPRPPLHAEITGTIAADDHVLEKVRYESLPGLYVTALLYRPRSIEGRLPAVVCVNGHWPQAKTTPDIQRRCVGLAKRGVIAFCQDVIGTGERAAPPGRPHPAYHGTYRGGVTRIVDRSLLGYVIYEGMRAVDYLQSRSDVDPKRIMCTGASGGGKQSMFLPAVDDRVAASVPVCYISSYQAHMGATACVGEVPTGILQYTNQWELLGMHAPRPLLCISASKDVPVFQPVHMHQTVRRTRKDVYRLYGADDLVSVEVIDSGHAYNKPMRELLYNFVAVHLQGAAPTTVDEPDDLPVRPADELRVGLPAQTETMQSLTYRTAKEMAESIEQPASRQEWQQQRHGMLDRLERGILNRPRQRLPVQSTRIRELAWNGHHVEQWRLEPEPGIVLPAVLCIPGRGDPSEKRDSRQKRRQPRPAVIVVDEQGKQHSFQRGFVEKLLDSGFVVLAVDYRGAGETAETVPVFRYEARGLEDYNLSNYSLYVGRPLMGMRADDIRACVDFLVERNEPAIDRQRISVAGRGRAGFAALLAALSDERINALAAEEMLASYVFDGEFDAIGMSYLVPRILEVGDIPHLAACLAPRPLILVNRVDARRVPLLAGDEPAADRFAESIYRLFHADRSILKKTVSSADVCGQMADWLRTQ